MPDIFQAMPIQHHTTMDDKRLERFDAAFRKHYETIRRHAGRVGSTDPDDVASECFSALWRRLDEVRPGFERAWLVASARKLTANQRRAGRRREALFEEAVANERLSAPTWQDEGGATDPLVEAVLSTLSPADRELLLLEAWDDLDQAEIAQVLGISRSTASVRLHRARWRFRREYARRHDLFPRSTNTIAGGC